MILTTLAARALGMDERLEALAADTRARRSRTRRSGHRQSAGSRARACRGPRQPLQARRCEADGDGWRERRLDTRAGAPCDGLRTFLVERPATTPTPSLDITRKFARIEFDGTRAVAVGPPCDQTELAKRVLDDAAVLLAAELIGVSEAANVLALDYAQARVVFDKPLSKFQVTR